MKFEVYKDAAGQWRWRLVAANGKLIANSGEGYKNRGDCYHGIELIQLSAADAEVVEV